MIRLWLASALMLMVGSVAAAAPPAPPPVEAYGKLPGAEEVSLSPSGQRYALIGVIGEQRKLVVGIVGGKPLRAINVGAAKVRSVDWAGEDHVLVTLTQTAKLGPEFTVDQAEVASALVLSVPTGKVLAVFDKHTDVNNAVMGEYGTAEAGGRWYGFFGAFTVGANIVRDNTAYHFYPDLYRVDLDSGDIKLMAEGSRDSDGWLVGADGEVKARATYVQDTGAWQVLAGARGGQVLASGQYPFGGVGLSWGRNAQTLLLSRPTDKGAIDEEVPLAGGAAVKAPDSDVMESRYFDRSTGLWIGYSIRSDRSNMTMFDPVANKRVAGAIKAFPDQVVTVRSWSQDFGRMVIFTTGGDDAGTYWIVDVATGKADPAGYQYPDVQPENIGPIKMVEWTAADGTVIHGVLSLPPGREPKNLPIVVLPHGGPESRDYPVFDWWAQAFASRGYAVLQPNFRGSSGYGVGFRNAGFGEWGRKMQTDVSDGLAALGRQGVVDTRRACIVGGSYGGYAALAGVTVQQGLYRCAVAVAGVSDLAGMQAYAHDQGGAASPALRYWRAFMGPASGFNAVSPVGLAARADAPILLIHGKDDTVVPFDQSASMQRALAAAHKPVELVTMPNEDHWLSREETRTLMLKSAVAFVEKNNPADPSN